MDIRCKIAVAMTAFQVVASGCHRAEIDLNGLLSEPGRAGSSEAVVGSGGAGGAEGDTGEMTDGDGGRRELEDTTPPRVLSTSPSDGESGVRNDATIVVRFSEPMNREQTARAVELDGIQTTAEWNELGTELSIVPVEPLAYGRGPDPPLVEPAAYSLSVNRLATDVAGNALDRVYATKFYTSRELSISLRGIDTLIGYAIDSDEPRDSTVGADPTVGDATDESMKGFFTGDLSRLPPETQAVTSATLTAGQYRVTGEPYEMGRMMLEHVSFSALQYVLTAPTKTSFGALFADAETKAASLDVTSAVQIELAKRADDAGQVQFRFAFERAVNLNGKTDEVRLNPITLDVSYLVP
jgi:hypothetical protein